MSSFPSSHGNYIRLSVEVVDDEDSTATEVVTEQLGPPAEVGKEKFITLRSYRNKNFYVKESVAFQSPTIKKMAEEKKKNGGGSSTTAGTNNNAAVVVALPNVDAKTLGTVLEYLNMKVLEEEGGEDASSSAGGGGDGDGAGKEAEEKQRTFEMEELLKRDLQELLDIVFAAQCLEIGDLAQIIDQAIRESIRRNPFPPSPDFFMISDMENNDDDNNGDDHR